MKEHRHWLGTRGRGTAVVEPGAQTVNSGKGIPLLLLPERVLFYVDASLLVAMESLSEEPPQHGGGTVARIAATLARLCVRPWES